MSSLLLRAPNREPAKPRELQEQLQVKFTWGMSVTPVARAQESCGVKTEAGIVPENRSAAGSWRREATLLTGRTKGQEAHPSRLRRGKSI